MTRRTQTHDPELQFHAAQILREPVGTTREVSFATKSLVLEPGHVVANVRGEARFMRTNRGILASVAAGMKETLSCARCLVDVPVEVACRFEEEFLPVIDVATGMPISFEDEPDAFRIDEHHVLDFAEALRQYALMVEPMAPVCRSSCAGLCPRCGQNRNERSCDCEQPTDPRWAALAALSGGTTTEVS